MSESQSVGGIHYDVAMDVKPMLSGERQVGSSLDRMEGNFNKASKSIDSAEKSMLSFSKAALAVSSAISVGAVVNMVDQWGQVAARIKMALKSVEGDIEKYASIQERFLEISNRNGKAIEDTQLLYVGAATSMQELGYSTEQTVDYIESLSSSLTANAASANETQSMINALNKAMVSGKVAGENWNSIMNATPTLIGDIAKQLSIMRGGVKVTEQDVKKLAADGKISFQLFADAVIRAKDANNAMADSMDNTVADGFTKLTNSAKAYFGELNQGLGITRSISAGFAVLSENFDKVAAAAVIATSVIGARYVGALSASIKAKIADAAASAKQVLSTRTAALAVREETQAIINNLTAERAKIVAQNQWMASQSVINRQMGINISYQKEYQANAIRIAAIDTQMATAKTQLAAATNQASIANRVYAASANALRGGLALIGGPMGAATLAAGAIFYFYQKSQEAKQEALAFADSVDELKNKMKELSDVALMGNVAEANNSIDAQREVIEKLQAELQTLNDNYQWTIKNTADWQNKAESLEKQQRDIAIKTKELEGAQGKLARTIQYVSDVTQELTHRNKDLYDAMNGASGSAGKMGAVLGALQQRIKAAADEKERLNNKMKESPETDDGKKYIQNLKDQNELLNIQDKKKRAIKKAEIEASKITENKGQIDAAKKLAEENYNLSEAEKKRESASKKSTSTGESESKKRANQLLELANANKVAELETKGLYREAAILESVLKLGSTATKAQVAEVSDLAGKEFDLKQKIKDREDAYKQNAGLQAAREQKLALEQLDRQLKANLVTEEQYQKRKFDIATEYANKIADIKVTESVTRIEENRAKFDPIQALANENTRKLTMMKEYYDQEQKLLSDSYAKQQITHEQFTVAKQATDMQYHMLLAAMDKQYQEQQTAAQWELMRNQSLSYEMMASAVDSFAGNASNVITGLMTGTMSAADAMRSLGNTMLNSVVNSLVQVGVEMLKNFIIGQTMGSAAAAASAGQAALVATAWAPAAALSSLATLGANAAAANTAIAGTVGMAKGLAVAGARYNGGPVGAGQMYQVGEHGKPEIFKASTGRQYMIPGDNGRVISNKDMQGSGNGITLNIEFNDYSSGKHQFEAQASQNGDTLTVQAFLTDMQEKGPMHRSITQNTTATTRL